MMHYKFKTYKNHLYCPLYLFLYVCTCIEMPHKIAKHCKIPSQHIIASTFAVVLLKFYYASKKCNVHLEVYTCTIKFI